MPLQVQCYAVVIRNDALERVLDDGADGFADIAPNSMSYADDMLSQASFMAQIDAEEFIKSLELRGLSRENEPPDFVVVIARTKEVSPACDWLQMFEYEGRLAVTMRGNPSTTLIASEHSGDLEHYTEEELLRDFEFVERKDNIDTYRNKHTGQLIYSARRTQTPEELFQEAFDMVWKHHREPGTPPIDQEAMAELRTAIETLQSLVSQYPELSRPRFALGMAWHAAGNLENARRQLEQSVALEPDKIQIYKELGSVCLAMRDHTAAVAVTEKGVAIEPDNVDLLGNLATCQLLAGSAEKAEETIQYALKLDNKDEVNNNIHQLIAQVRSGRRPMPGSLEELMGIPPPQTTSMQPQAKTDSGSPKRPRSLIKRALSRLFGK